jgi:hypothetical protein
VKALRVEKQKGKDTETLDGTDDENESEDSEDARRDLNSFIDDDDNFVDSDEGYVDEAGRKAHRSKSSKPSERSMNGKGKSNKTSTKEFRDLDTEDEISDASYKDQPKRRKTSKAHALRKRRKTDSSSNGRLLRGKGLTAVTKKRMTILLTENNLTVTWNPRHV